jgi:addiction module HigA family antidote
MNYKTLQDIRDAKELISPPGDTLRETIEARGISQKDLALRMNRPFKTINEIIQGKTAIIPETALQLERVLNIPADFWLERERRYRLNLAEIVEAEQILKNKEWIQNFPLAAMKKLGWIKYEGNNFISQTESLYSFFGVAGQEGYYSYYHKEVYATAYRMSKSNGKSPYSVAAWLRRGEHQAENSGEVPEYNTQCFKEALTEVKNIMARQPTNFFTELQKLCAKAGVKVVYTPCLPHTQLHGSTRWINGKPVIQLSNLYQRNDIFWFTFYHESAHIIKHSKKQMFVEGLGKYNKEQLVLEREADEFAQNYTLSLAEEKIIKETSTIDRAMIEKFATQFNTHPAIIIGRLARNNKRLNKYGWTSHFFQKIELNNAR